jgi:hypothetical protein
MENVEFFSKYGTCWQIGLNHYAILSSELETADITTVDGIKTNYTT